MSSKNQKKQSLAKPAENSSEKEPQVNTGGWTEKQPETPWKDFPVPGVHEMLRVNFTPQAYADLICHAKENISSEVCGVLVGNVLRDANGHHVSVQAIIRGASTRAGSSHVTYTQETWNQIHKTMEKDYPKQQIVGWYHSHPGFGVEFSDMDLFIHQNFFSGRGQVAFVTDPLGGEEAICVKSGEGMEHLERFWIDGRERKCRSSSSNSTVDKDSTANPSPQNAKALQAVEDRLTQALVAIEELRNSYYRFLTIIGMLVACGVLFWIGNTIYSHLVADTKPPEMQAFAPGPMKIGNEWRWVGTSLVTKKLSPEQEQHFRQAEQEGFLLLLQQQQQQEQEKQQNPKETPPQNPTSDIVGPPKPKSNSPQENPKP